MSLPIGLSGVFSTIHNSAGPVIMGVYGQITELGWYNAPLRLIDIIFILASLVSISFFPTLNKAYKESSKRFYKIWNVYFQLMFSLAVPLIVGGIVLAPKIIGLIYGSKYLPSILVLRILILFIGISFISEPFNQILFIFNKQKNLFWISLFGVTVNIALNLILIPAYSLYGVAIIRVITYLLMFVLLLRYFSKLTTIDFFNLRFVLFLVGVTTSSALMYFAVSIPQIYNFHLLFVIMIGVIVYLASLLGCKNLVNLLLKNE